MFSFRVILDTGKGSIPVLFLGRLLLPGRESFEVVHALICPFFSHDSVPSARSNFHRLNFLGELVEENDPNSRERDEELRKHGRVEPGSPAASLVQRSRLSTLRGCSGARGSSPTMPAPASRPQGPHPNPEEVTQEAGPHQGELTL